MSCSLCSPDVIAAPQLPNITVLELFATPVTGYEIPQTQVPNQGLFPPGSVDFCNVTITYSHPSIRDQAIVEVWLPSQEDWNERILAVGGGGFVAGRLDYAQMAGVVNEGFATYTTDAGLADPMNAAGWALDSSGHIDEDMIEYWGQTSLGDMTAIGKSVVASFYGKAADYSYYSGCSMGGLQGYSLAQNFPGEYDGIAAAAPAIRLHEILMAWLWPQLQMKLAGEFPYNCETDSLTALAVKACDSKDGVKDGFITDPYVCDPFDVFAHVGSPASKCRNQNETKISEAAAFAVNTTWGGVLDEAGQPIFFAQLPGTDLSGLVTTAGVAATTCNDVGEECTGALLPLGPIWLQVFGLEDPTFRFEDLTLEQYYEVLRGRKDFFDQYVGSIDTDLSNFRDAGGKLITIHGLADQTIPSGLVRDYYEQVLAVDPSSPDFYRYFEVPAMGHCSGIGHPNSTFNALREWVEGGVVPESLPVSLPVSGNPNSRIVCPYPQVADFLEDCGDATIAECFSCQ